MARSTVIRSLPSRRSIKSVIKMTAAAMAAHSNAHGRHGGIHLRGVVPNHKDPAAVPQVLVDHQLKQCHPDQSDDSCNDSDPCGKFFIFYESHKSFPPSEKFQDRRPADHEYSLYIL